MAAEVLYMYTPYHSSTRYVELHHQFVANIKAITLTLVH